MEKGKVFTVVAAIVTLFAMIVSSSACFIGLYQPKEPKGLKKLF